MDIEMSLEEMLKRKNMILKDNYRIYTMELSKKLALEGVGIGWGLKKCIEEECVLYRLVDSTDEKDNTIREIFYEAEREKERGKVYEKKA